MGNGKTSSGGVDGDRDGEVSVVRGDGGDDSTHSPIVFSLDGLHLQASIIFLRATEVHLIPSF
eukprot:CAMPEP_0174258346 /NCGR_PEP_ID=MMETSP0439-20130205/7352_1 /TAXON_ID=0 /ORGANISM="Stereomyxa ramosa, Strain Chinc5" /LENGTH=62 /DNA_ID=CAMNT_0015341817 /DNA_START=463 /DNA_END=648 /DNA_ORIENTATION=-